MFRCVFDAIGNVQPCVLTSAVHQAEACALPVVLIISRLPYLLVYQALCIIQVVASSPACWVLETVYHIAVCCAMLTYCLVCVHYLPVA